MRCTSTSPSRSPVYSAPLLPRSDAVHHAGQTPRRVSPAQSPTHPSSRAQAPPPVPRVVRCTHVRPSNASLDHAPQRRRHHATSRTTRKTSSRPPWSAPPTAPPLRVRRVVHVSLRGTLRIPAVSGTGRRTENCAWRGLCGCMRGGAALSVCAGCDARLMRPAPMERAGDAGDVLHLQCIIVLYNQQFRLAPYLEQAARFALPNTRSESKSSWFVSPKR
ncbi:hypothetical protein HYPSUDRAFT_893667 [Hypholoma sublateritium FD-334 SS-4]|uniref:Uncharacterized protein n=1 Tax=Hypholoma sublateritium (strain FD-334 SS-4) TaxID=945553 RepID=A0A0D2M7Y7_HYPSF|nr:hypothetical protein HYPSUDRAFT_893667 [Hypholoma sublateritium FD-334 SS-4]